MGGVRPKNPRSGDRAEYLGTFLISWIAQAVPIPRQEDFGVDFRGGLLHETGGMMMVGRRFAVQIKSNLDTLFLPVGRPKKRRRKVCWNEGQVRWLLGRPPFVVDTTPLFLGHVDLEKSEVALYSTAPMWNARWLGYPTEIEFDRHSWPPAADVEMGRQPFTLRTIDDCYPAGAPEPISSLGRVVIPVGPPVVRIRLSDAASDKAAQLRRQIVATMDEWIRLDTLNRLASTLEVPACFWHAAWSTNVPPVAADQEASSYAHSDPEGGLSADDIERSLRPFVLAWDRVRTAQGGKSIASEIQDRALLDKLKADPVRRAVEIERLRTTHGSLAREQISVPATEREE